MKAQIACCQMIPIDDKQKNLEKAASMVRREAAAGTDIVVLPEMFICPYCHASFKDYCEPASGASVRFLSALARETGVILFAGSIPEKEDDRIYNTCFVFDRQGRIIGRHRKVHLFDVDIKGGISFKESKVLSPGNTLTVVDTEFGKIGAAICFDIRFVEPFRIMAEAGARLIVVPAAFNMTTGPLHWELAIRSRAVDNQCYIAACSSGRDTSADYCAWGHSSVVDPWGKVVATTGPEESIVRHTLDFDLVEQVRQELPILASRRQDLYTCTLSGGKHIG